MKISIAALFSSMLVGSQASEFETFAQDIINFANCIAGASDKLQPKFEVMANACESLSVYDPEDRVLKTKPKIINGQSFNADINVPEIDLDDLDDNAEEFENFCYDYPDCKNAYRDVLRTYIDQVSGCYSKLPSVYGDFTDVDEEFEEALSSLDELCPDLTHNLIARFILNGVLEDYNNDDAKRRIIKAVADAAGLVIAPLATVVLAAGSVVAEVTIPTSSEEEASQAKSNLESNQNIDASFRAQGFSNNTVQEGSMEAKVGETGSGLSAGAIAGIVIGCIVGVLILAAIIVLVLRAQKGGGSGEVGKSAGKADAPVVTGVVVESGGEKA
eukprot:scaffold152315_cov30-Tisochrysis_lutea.AAC.1